MTAPMQIEKAVPSIFNMIALGMQDIAKDLSDSIIMKLIYSIRKEQEELNTMHEYILKNKESLLDGNLENLYDELMISEDNISELLKMTNEHKKKSDIFVQINLATQELLNDYTRVIEEITNIELELIHQGNLKYAS